MIRERHTSPTNQRRLAASSPAKQASDSATTALDVESALDRLNGDRTLYRRLLSIFVCVHAHSAQRCAEALLAGDDEPAMVEVHRLASAASGIGAARLRNVSRAIEEGLRGQSSRSALPLLPMLLAEHAAALAAAALTLAGPSGRRSYSVSNDSGTISISASRVSLAPIVGTLDPRRTLRDRLSLCAILLEQCDVAAVDCVESLSGLVRSAPRLEALLTQLHGRVNIFDFDGARRALRTLREYLDLHSFSTEMPF